MNYAANMTAGSYREPQAAPASPIPCAIGQLDAAISEMGVMAESLANRLGSVLMPSPPTAESKGPQLATAMPPASHITDSIHIQRHRVENIAAQLQDVRNRLEV